MNVSDILAATGATGTNGSRSTGNVMGKDSFMKILVAQLQNQDPTQPMQDRDFIAQMAQFSALEQMQQLTASFGYSQAYALMGKAISATVKGSDGAMHTVSGIVSAVTTVAGAPYLLVGDALVPMTASITAADADNTSVMQSAMLLGRTITAKVAAADGATTTVTGIVKRVGIADGQMVAYVDGQEKPIPLSSITEVAI